MKATLILRHTLKYLLLAFTAACTSSLLGRFFSGTEVFYLQWIGLAAFEGGAWIWNEYAKGGGEGSWPRNIAYIMIGVDVIAVAVSTGAELALLLSKSKLTSLPGWFYVVVGGAVVSVVLINVVALIFVEHLTDAQRERTREEERAEAQADALDFVEKQNTEAIKAQARTVASEVAPQAAQAWGQRMLKDYRAKAGLSGEAPQLTIEGTYTQMPTRAQVQPYQPQRRKRGLVGMWKEFLYGEDGQQANAQQVQAFAKDASPMPTTEPRENTDAGKA